ncbi:transglutaminase domain-containing protein [Ulvibacter litoralis]|uniref:Uncharacterized protein n=1 Tax=Ulvibacter litoralis TaxID=227084 RepID=A0A1G7C512_9FLAO|nr:DUF3857 domain-containing protein [Ulvibacter litoralis]GHC48628.1 hypothetical protein GCM10008083_10010 [Ulvibacter litoralis]SDE34401.1 protein of unknown function [Ulvibacter litoralis]
MKRNTLFLFIFVFTVQISVAQNFKFGKVSVEELKEKSHPTDPEAHAAILYREYKASYEQSVDWGFYIVEDFHERIKIYDKEGFDWATKQIILYQAEGGKEEDLTGLKAYTYYLDESGKVQEKKLTKSGIFKEEVNEFWNEEKFTMPDLKEGCVIEFKYSIKSAYINGIDEYRFQETIPVNKVSLRIAVPEYYNYKLHQNGWLPYQIKNNARDRTMSYSYKLGTRSGSAADLRDASKVERTDITFKENIYTVDIDNVPALKEEPYAPYLDNYSASLKMELSYVQYPNSSVDSYATTWEAVSNSIYNSSGFGVQLNKSNYFKDEIDTLLSGVSSPEEKTLLIFEFVKKKMAWNNFNSLYSQNGVRNAFKEGTGNVADINLMLTAMLRYAGLNANPILLSTKKNGIPLFPTRNGFNYLICGVEISNHVLLLDATDKEAEIDILKPELLNWKGRIIREEGSSTWVPLIPTKPAVESTLLTVAINEDLAATGSLKSRFTGHYSKLYRDNYANVNKDDVRKIIEKDKGEIEVSNIEFENLKTLYKPVVLSYDFEKTDAVEEVGGKLYLSPLLYLATEESPFKLDDRKYPIDFMYPVKDRYLVTIAIPEGYQVESMPESASFVAERNVLGFRYALSNAGGKIQISVEYSVNEPFIGADEYLSLKKFYELLIEKEKEKIVLVKA